MRGAPDCSRLDTLCCASRKAAGSLRPTGLGYRRQARSQSCQGNPNDLLETMQNCHQQTSSRGVAVTPEGAATKLQTEAWKAAAGDTRMLIVPHTSPQLLTTGFPVAAAELNRVVRRD
jgi:hypothetical protein